MRLAEGAAAVTKIHPLAVVSACIRRDWVIARSYRLPFAMDAFQRLATLLFLFLLARLVESRATGHSGFVNGYFGFVVVGTALLGVVTTSLNSFSDRLRLDQTTGTLEALVAAPSPPWLTVLAGGSYQLVYAVAGASLTVAVGVVGFGMRFHVQPAGVPLAVIGLIAGIALFCALGVAFAAFVMVFKWGSGLAGVVGTGLTLLGGVYYPVRLLPAPLRILANLIPFTWAVDVLRKTLLAGDLPLARLALLCIGATMSVPVSLWVLSGAVARARRSGTLGQF